MIIRWIKSVFGPSERIPPTPSEMQAAIEKRDEYLKLCVFGEIGGKEPEKDKRATSWWGGNFLAAAGEDIPTCQQSGRVMHPVLQVRVDELPEVPPAFQGISLINLWMDLQSEELWESNSGNGFIVRTYASFDGLIPVGFGYRESSELPTFPILWRETAMEQPSWEDFADGVPTSVAQSRDEEWFDESDYSVKVEALRKDCPVKLGGWPTWIQGSYWPKDAEYLLQIDSTDKGKWMFGDMGSIYLFRTPDGWEIRGDCY